MEAEEWLSTAAGIWWLPAIEGTKATEWLGPQSRRRIDNERICVVPSGGPLITSLSAISHCQMWCGLHEIRPDEHEVVTALRTVEVADARQRIRASRLSTMECVSTWLAAARLSRAATLVMIEPGRGLSGLQLGRLKRLTREAVDWHRRVLLIGPDSEVPLACGASSLAQPIEVQ